jgi:SAM-dependent methyltransferase
MTEHERRVRAEQRERFDFAVIANWIPPGEHVLDLGCGDGRLLRYLSETRDVSGYGVEIDHESVLGCIRNGVDVIQMDIECGLSVSRTIPSPDARLAAPAADRRMLICVFTGFSSGLPLYLLLNLLPAWLRAARASISRPSASSR